MKSDIQHAQLVDLTRQGIRLIDGKGVFSARCADCGDRIKARYTLKNGKIPAGTFAIHHAKQGHDPCMPTVLKFDIAAIPGSDETRAIETRVEIEDSFGVRYGSYPCLCGDTVRFAVEKPCRKTIWHRHERCGFISALLLVFDRKYERRRDVLDHVIVPLDSNYAVMGKMQDYSKGGANIKLTLKKTDQETLSHYFETDRDIQIIQYKGDINKSDFPYPYNMNREDFGFTVLKISKKASGEQPTDRNKIYRQAVIISYAFNPETEKTELRLKFL